MLTPGEEAALEEAAATGEAVEVPEYTDELSVVEANPDGTFTLSTSRETVRVDKGDGWVPVDTTLVSSGAGYQPTATAVDVTFSDGGSGPLAVVETADGSLSMSVPFRLPQPVVSGSSLLYREVLPGVDLQVDVQAESFTEVLVVKSAQAARNPRLASFVVDFEASGLAITVGAGGGSVVSNADGEVLFTSPPPSMWDSTPSEALGVIPSAVDRGMHTPVLGTEVVDQTPAKGGFASPAGDGARVAEEPVAETASEVGLELTPPVDELRGSDVVYPVFIDPSLGAQKINYATVWQWSGSDFNVPGDPLKVGNCGWPGCGAPGEISRGFFNLDVGFLAQERNGARANVVSAKLHAWLQHNAASWSTPVNLYSAGDVVPGMVWPGPVGGFLQQSWTAGPGAVMFDAVAIRDYVQMCANNGWGNVGFGLISADEGNRDWWKRFDPAFWMEVVFTFPTAVPSQLGVAEACGTDGFVGTRTPELRAYVGANEANLNWPTSGEFVLVLPNGTSRSSGWVSIGADGWLRWRPSAPLADGHYRFKARSRTITPGGGAEVPNTVSAFSGETAFVVDADLPAPPSVTNASLEGPVVPSRVGAGDFVVSANGDTSVTGFAYAFDGGELPTYSWPAHACTGVVWPDEGFVPVVAGGTARIPFPWAAVDPRMLSVRAVHRSGNVSEPTIYEFVTRAMDSTVEYVAADGLSWQGGRVVSGAAPGTVRFEVDDGAWLTTRIAGAPFDDPYWQVETWLAADSQIAGVVPRIDGELFTQWTQTGPITFSLHPSEADPAPLTQVFADLPSGGPGTAEFEFGLQVDCADGATKCVVGVEKIGLVNTTRTALGPVVPSSGVRRDTDSYYLMMASGSVLAGLAHGATSVSVSVGGATHETAVGPDGVFSFGSIPALASGSHNLTLTATGGDGAVRRASVTTLTGLTDPAITRLWSSWAHEWLGVPTGVVAPVAGGVSVQPFSGGKVYKTDGGAFSVHGGIGTTYADAGGYAGLGAPVSGEVPLAGGAAVQYFERGQISWHPTQGIVVKRY